MATPDTPTALVADDEPDIRDMVRILLETDGFEVVCLAANGAEAVECFDELETPPDPHIVVLDNRMPVMTGIEAAEQILARRPDQVVVLFTAHVDEPLRARARSVGIAACAEKTKAAELPTLLRGLLTA